MSFTPLTGAPTPTPTSGVNFSAQPKPMLSESLWSQLAAPKPAPKPDPLASVHIGGTNTTGTNSLTDALGLSGASKNLSNMAQNLFDPVGAQQRGVPLTNPLEAAGTGAQVSSIVNPIKGIGTAAISGATMLGGQAAANNQDFGTIAKQSAIGGVLGGAIGLAGKAASAVGKGVYKYIIPRSTREAEMLQKYRANTPFLERIQSALQGKSKAPRLTADTAFDKGLAGTEEALGVQGQRAAKNLWDDLIEPSLKRSNRTTDLQGFFARTAAEIEATTPEMTRQSSLLEALSSVADDYAGHKPVTDIELQALKSGWAEFVAEKSYRGKPIAGALNEVRAMLANQARNDIYAAVGPEAKLAYIDYGNLKGIQELGVKAMTGGKTKGGTGGFLNAIKDMLLTPIATIGGQTVYKAGQGVELFGPKGLSTVGELINSMTSSGQSPNTQTTPLPEPITSSTSQDNTTDAFKSKFGVTEDEWKAKYGKYVDGAMGMGAVKPVQMANYVLKDGLIALLEQTPSKIGNALNGKLAQEASDILTALKAQNEPNEQLMRQGLEVARLLGHDVSKVVQNALDEGTAALAQLHDDLGRFTNKFGPKK